jgi:hypothetical protein
MAIQYVRSYRLYLKDLSVHNLRTRHAVVTCPYLICRLIFVLNFRKINRPANGMSNTSYFNEINWEPGRSVSIVSGYRLDDRAIEVRCPTKAKWLFLWPLCPDRQWGPPSLLSNEFRGSFSRCKAQPGRDADHSPHLVPRLWISRSYTSSLPCASIGVLWYCFTFTFYNKSIKISALVFSSAFSLLTKLKFKLNNLVLFINRVLC